jgi:hypothetical protein
MKRLKSTAILILTSAITSVGIATAQLTVDIPNRTEAPGTTFSVPVLLGEAVTEGDNVSAFELTIAYDASVLAVTGASVTGTIADNPDLFDVDTSSPDAISVTAAYSSALSGSAGDELLNLTVAIDASASGSRSLRFTAFRFNEGNPSTLATSGLISVESLSPKSNLVINEIHADPASGLAGDANNDGTRSATEDEFVEFVNAGGSAIDMSGYTVSDETEVRFTFPTGTILNTNGSAVVFGGGTPTGIPGLVFAATGLGLNNGSDAITLSDDQGNPVVAVHYGSGAIADESVTRSPDIDGPFMPHSDAAPDGELFSPGRTLDGAVLPVELSAFEAVKDGRDAVLRWRTASETNNSGFAVQQLREGAFHEIAFLAGAGTTSRPQRYNYRVRNLEPGVHTFRLEQMDFDGAATPSHAVEVTIPLATSFTLDAAYPNPFRTTARATLRVRETQPVTVRLFNVLGQHVQRVYDGTVHADVPETFTLDGADLPSGVYVYQVRGRTFSAERHVTLVK